MTAPNPLERRQLGATAMNVTAVSLGGAGLGGIFGPVDDAEGVSAVEKALELGINYLDTSPKYGEQSGVWDWR
jgi:aryl-alcohol dehydrogenase-like predicted oxidoreductase